MADIDLKTETPDTTLPTTGFLFGADSQAAASPSVYSTQTVATTLLGSTSLTGATVTTSSPVIDAAQTWNDGAVTFTGLKFNATDTASASASLLMDLQAGTNSKFTVSKSGVIRGSVLNLWTGAAVATGFQIVYMDSNGVQVMNTGRFSFGSINNAGATQDTILTRRAAANLRLGAADVGATTATVTITIAAPGVVTWNSHTLSTGTPVVFTTTGALPTGITAGTTYYAVVVDGNTFQLASSVANAIAATPTVITTSGSQSGTHTGTRYNITQRLGTQGVTGVTDRLGADLIIQGSQGTGTGAGGSIIFQVAPAGSSGTAQNALTTAWTVDSASRLIGSSGGTAAAPAISLPNNTGLFAPAINILAFSLEGTERARFEGALGFGLARDGWLWWSSNQTNGLYSNRDTVLARDAANTLALRNGANAQESRVYGSYTSATNFQRMSIKTLRESSGALSGASYTTTIAIPAYANLIGVTTRVTTEVTGATTYDVGDGTDVDLWGAAIGVALGSQSRTADFTAVGAVGAAATSRTVTLTANGSNFTGGVVEICLHYITTEAD